MLVECPKHLTISSHGSKIRTKNVILTENVFFFFFFFLVVDVCDVETNILVLSAKSCTIILVQKTYDVVYRKRRKVVTKACQNGLENKGYTEGRDSYLNNRKKFGGGAVEFIPLCTSCTWLVFKCQCQSLF